MFKNEKPRFLIRVTIAHMVTYFVCGAFFSLALSYEAVWQSGMFGGHDGFMRDYSSVWIYLGPFLQVFRGLLFGGILLVIPKEFFSQKYAWLKLWLIVAGIGIINTPGPGNGSIEGVIYTNAPWQAHTIYCIEIFLQTLWFSFWVCRNKKGASRLAKLKFPLIAAGIAVFSMSILGFLTAVTSGADPMAGAQDIGAMAVMLLIFALVLFAALWYTLRPEKRFIAFICLCYCSCALPIVVYDYLRNPASLSPLSLLPALLPTFIIWLIFRIKANKAAAPS